MSRKPEAGGYAAPNSFATNSSFFSIDLKPYVLFLVFVCAEALRRAGVSKRLQR
jgi:hypothetical protein